MITKSIEKNKEEKQVKQDDAQLVASFFYDDFLEKMNVKSARIKELVTLVEELARLTEDENILPLIHGTVAGAQRESVLESQLFWERQWDIHTDDKKEREVENLCLTYIQRRMQLLMKLSRIPAADKQALHEKMRKVLMAK